MTNPASASAGGPSGERYRWLITFRIEGDLRFISHHDTLRLWSRALNRTGLPLRFTEGFNPHPRIMLPLPRPVGIASRAELLVFETLAPIDPDEACERLQEVAPTGLTVLGGRRLADAERVHPTSVRYQLLLPEPPPPDWNDRLRQILEAKSLQVRRPDPEGGEGRTIDVRPYLLELSGQGQALEFTLKVTRDGTARPGEIAGLLGLDPKQIHHRIERLEVQWQ